jgi:hypothetical protein
VARLAALTLLAALVALAASGAAAGPPPLALGEFAPPRADGAPPEGWRPLTFRKIPRLTRYRVERDGDRWVVRAEAERSASALYRPVEADPRVHRILSWRWKVEAAVAGADARTRAGDDYAARVYVAFRYDAEAATLWERVRYGAYHALYGEYPPKVVLNYVWDNRLPVGTVLDNAYTDRSKMVVLRSGNAEAGRWVGERRDVYDDYRRIVGGEPPAIAGVAIMTDTDDTGAHATAWYDAITLAAPE